MVAPLAVLLGLACSGLPAGGGHFLIVGRATPPVESGLPTLQFTDVDVENMREVGLRLFCFQPTEITVLSGPDATADRVLAVLASLTSRARGGRIGRLFVYVSAHGERSQGVLLDRALPAAAFFEAIAAVGARQTFSFLDTCDSASMGGLPKGAVTLRGGWDEGHFHLTASAGTTRELSRLRGSEATQDFLSAVYLLAGREPQGPVFSTDLCRHLHHHALGTLEGGCAQRFQGGEGVLLVPNPRPPGRLDVEVRPGSGPWRFVLAPVRNGHPMGGFPARSAFRGEAISLPSGSWQVRRIDDARGVCETTRVDVGPGQTTTVREDAWGSDPAYCPAVERAHRTHVEPVGRAVSWSVGDAHGRGMARVGLSAPFRAPGRLGVSVQASPRSVSPLKASPIHDLGLVGGWDPLSWSFGELDALIGFELGGGLQLADRSSVLTGALRLGWRARIARGWQPELLGHGGVQVGAWERVTLRLGISVGVHHAL